jgi:hypothetical protein
MNYHSSLQIFLSKLVNQMISKSQDLALNANRFKKNLFFIAGKLLLLDKKSNLKLKTLKQLKECK